MKTTLFIYFLILLSLSGVTQELDIPIENEDPKRGIYKNFEEFKFNIPSITDTFHVERKVRIQKKWKGTYSLIPRYSENNKKVKKVWGFSDGQKTYVFHQWEYFEAKIDSGRIGFYAYKQLDISGAASAAMFGLAGGVYAGAVISAAKKKRIYYQINPINGNLHSFQTKIDASGMEGQMTKLVLYRRSKKEMNEPLNILINDSLEFELIPYSIKEIDVPITRNPLKICYGKNSVQCMDLAVISTDIIYLEGSISSKLAETKLEEVKIEVGEFYSKQAKFYQNKRENKDNNR